MAVDTIDEAEKFIKKWMSDRGYLEDELRPDGTAFQLTGKFDTGVVFSIIQPQNLIRSFAVVAQIDIHSSHLLAIQSMSDEELGKFLWGLRRDLFFTIPSFAFIPAGADVPNAIQFSKQISFDELTEGRLYNTVEYTCRCVLWVALVLTGKFGQPVEEEEEGHE